MAIELNGAPPELVNPIRAALLAVGVGSDNILTGRQTVAGLAFTAPELGELPTTQWDLKTSSMTTLTLTGNRALELLNLQPGVYRLRVIQGTTGGHTIASWPGVTLKTPGGNPIALSADAEAEDILRIECFGGTTVYVSAALDYQEP